MPTWTNVFPSERANFSVMGQVLRCWILTGILSQERQVGSQVVLHLRMTSCSDG